VTLVSNECVVVVFRAAVEELLQEAKKAEEARYISWESFSDMHSCDCDTACIFHSKTSEQLITMIIITTLLSVPQYSYV